MRRRGSLTEEAQIAAPKKDVESSWRLRNGRGDIGLAFLCIVVV